MAQRPDFTSFQIAGVSHRMTKIQLDELMTEPSKKVCHIEGTKTTKYRETFREMTVSFIVISRFSLYRNSLHRRLTVYIS